MTTSRIEFPEKNSFSPKEITKDVLYKAESYTEDGEKVDLYMELLTDDNINKWDAYMDKAISSASELIDSNPSKKSALNEVSRAIHAQMSFITLIGPFRNHSKGTTRSSPNGTTKSSR